MSDKVENGIDENYEAMFADIGFRPQPDPPAVSKDLMLTDEEMKNTEPADIPVCEQRVFGCDACSAKCVPIAKAQLKACQDYYQPVIDGLRQENEQLKEAIEQFENNDPIGLQAYYLKKAREMK